MWHGFPRCVFSGDLDNRFDVLRFAPTTSADDIDEFVLREIVHPLPHFGWGLSILTEFIGESSVRITDNRYIRYLRHLDEIRTNLLGTEATVQPSSKQVRVPNRIPEGFDCLSGEVSTATTTPVRGDDKRNVNTACFSEGLYGKECRLTVKRIHDGFNEKEIGTPVN